jgi:phosphoglycolate phosphatase-like HAD superfamily hydrolase
VLRAILFDLDGTLVDTGVTVPAAYAATIAALEGPAVPPLAVVAAYPLGPTKAILEHFLAREVSADEVDRYYAHLAEAGPIEPYPGVRAALEELRGRVTLGVYTGAGTQACRVVLERAGLATLFDVVVGGDEVTRPKPDPEGLPARRAPARGSHRGDRVYRRRRARHRGRAGVRGTPRRSRVGS